VLKAQVIEASQLAVRASAGDSALAALGYGAAALKRLE
jgi:hypothetical protein